MKVSSRSDVTDPAEEFARSLIIGGKDPMWVKRARGYVSAVYRVAREEPKAGVPCETRTIELLLAHEDALLERMARSIAISVSVQAKLLIRAGARQRTSLIHAVRLAASKRQQSQKGSRV
jgi:hypothetical protein